MMKHRVESQAKKGKPEKREMTEFEKSAREKNRWDNIGEIATLGIGKEEIECVEPAQDVPQKCKVPMTFIAQHKSRPKRHKNLITQKIMAMVDTGQNIKEGVIISKQLCKRLGLLEFLEHAKNTSVSTASKGAGLKIIGKVKKRGFDFFFQ